MNWAHVHLLSNHVPVLGALFGLALLTWAAWRRDAGLSRVALGTFVVVALIALPVYFTGEPAEDVVEHAQGVSESLIETHEGAALLALMGIEILGVAALVVLYLSRARRTPARAAMRTVWVLAIVSAGLMARTANLGGQIRHEEARGGVQAPAGETEGDDGDASAEAGQVMSR